MKIGNAIARLGLLALGVLLSATPAAAQWSRVAALPVTDVFVVRAFGDTIVAGVDTATYVSTNAGLTWKLSARPAPAVVVVDAAWVRNGRLYAGTFGQGVFVSDDLGTTWQAFNQGLTGGFANSQLSVSDLVVRGDSLYAATEGAGVYMRNLAAADTWHHFGEEFEPNQASNVVSLALGGNRLVANASANGEIFFRDPGDPEWTLSPLNNVGLAPGFSAQSAAWTGSAWLVGTNFGVFHGATGAPPWSFFDPGLGALSNTWFAVRGGRAFAAFTAANFTSMQTSNDDGATWQELESLSHVFVFQLAMVGPTLYAGRIDGLWVRDISTVSVPPGAAPGGVALALVGAQPFTEAARMRFTLAEPGTASIEVYDVRGRRVGDRIAGAFGAGPHDVTWNAQALPSGVYAARLTAGGRRAVVKLVHVR
jgi:hypothetical protein